MCVTSCVLPSMWYVCIWGLFWSGGAGTRTFTHILQHAIRTYAYICLCLHQYVNRCSICVSFPYVCGSVDGPSTRTFTHVLQHADGHDEEAHRHDHQVGGNGVRVPVTDKRRGMQATHISIRVASRSVHAEDGARRPRMRGTSRDIYQDTNQTAFLC